jgi:capsular polysaccharide biosynthesis protein
MTRSLAPITRHVSRPFGARALPQRIYRSTSEFVDATKHAGVTYQVVQPGEKIPSRPPSIGIPESDRFVKKDGWDIPPGFVVTIDGGRVVGDYVAVIAPDNSLLMDVSPSFSLRTPDEHPMFRRLRLPEVEYWDARVAVLTRPFADNFFHFLLDVVPRLGLVERAHPLAEIDYFLVPRTLRFQREVLDLVGISSARVLEHSARTHICARSLIVPSMPCRHRQFPSWALRYLQEKLGSSVATSSDKRRIYISRGRKSRTRRVVNEEEVLDMLRAHGFESIRLDQLPLSEQISAFRSAEAVVAPHGAGLSHLVFCQPSTTVIELFAPGFVNPVFWNLSCQMTGMNYCYLFGEGGARVPTNQQDVRAVIEDFSDDITVDIGKLERMLANMNL